jgi:hypothetical protein
MLGVSQNITLSAYPFGIESGLRKYDTSQERSRVGLTDSRPRPLTEATG